MTIKKPEKPEDVPDFVNTLRMTGDLFVPLSRHIKYDPYNPEAVDCAHYDGAHHFYVRGHIGS